VCSRSIVESGQLMRPVVVDCEQPVGGRQYSVPGPCPVFGPAARLRSATRVLGSLRAESELLRVGVFSSAVVLQWWGQSRVIPLPIRTTPMTAMSTTATTRLFSSSRRWVDSSQPFVFSGATSVAMMGPATVVAETMV
jgi:hypothetical protein